MMYLFPELPFIIRMGYVCMVLISVAVILVLTDSHKTKAPEVSPENKKKLLFAGKAFGAAAVITLVAGLLFGTEWFGMSMRNLGFHSIFMLTFMMAFLSIIMYTNANSSKQDAKAYTIEPELFKTDKTFFLGAMGIVVIIVALYAVFW